MPKPVKKTDQDKPWNRKGGLSKLKTDSKLKGKTFRIFCEGKNTEAIYFRSFKLRSNHTVKSLGLGMSKSRLVEEVIDTVKSYKKDKDDLIWVVLDKDVSGKNGEDEDFNNAIRLAKDNGFNVAYSNDCFELWIYLHFYDTEVAWRRNIYFDKLSQHFEISYEREGKRKSFCIKLYEKLLPNQAEAIRKANRLHENHKNKNPFDQDPCTTVYQLVEELNKYIKQ